MKKILILIPIIILFSGCATIGNYENEYYEPSIRIIKYVKFGELKYETYTHCEICGSYLKFVGDYKNKPVTNYVYGDFELMNYEQYYKETKGKK